MIDKLKLAIDIKDWALVVEFYRQLTGTMEAPEVKSPPKQVSEVRGKSGTDDFTMRPVKQTLGKEKPVGRVKAEAKSVSPKRGKKKAVKAKAIEFIDTGEGLDEPGSDKINDNVPLTPRKRKPFKTVVMACVLCKKTEEVAPLFKRDAGTYKCNSCLSKGKVNGPE